MDIAFNDITAGQHTTESRSIYCDRAQLLTTLVEASTRATALGHEVLGSLTLSMPARDPLTIFSAFQELNLGNRFYWERPAEQHALVGVGSATQIETTGPQRVTDASTLWRELQQHAVVHAVSADIPTYTSGPILFGGFTFDVLNAHTDLWQGFPDGLLVLPDLLFHQDEHSAALTINTIIQPDATTSDLIYQVEKTQSMLATLSVAIDRVSLQPVTSIQNKLALHDVLSPATWKRQVADAVQMIQQQAFDKIVLARAVQVTNTTEQPFSIPATLRRLRTGYPGAYVFAIQRAGRYFVGATPERLVCSSDGQIQTMALAGSAPRGTTEEADTQLGAELLQSPKNQQEHHVVVTMIQQALTTLCSRVWVAAAPHLLKLKNIQHLQTPISGDLRPGHSILEAIEYLHPTPAVGGYPRLPALAAIRAHERLDRGWYAGPIGWIGTNGNGEFAVALRSGLITENQATLFAGCGIVADSDPESEYAESCLKLQVMLRGLGDEAEE